MSFLVLPKVTVNLPTTTISTNGWSLPAAIELADPAFFQSKEVDIVLGIEAFFEFFETGRRFALGDGLPTLNESVFGWVVCGGYSNPGKVLQINCNLSAYEELESKMAKFWSCEEVEDTNPYSPGERRCEKSFEDSVRRGFDGRYSVSLPKEGNALSRLGESQRVALRRFLGIERRLARDATLREYYVSFMKEYLSMGHMQKVEEIALGTGKRCYLPHHPVVKEESTTTKVRVVFDASCKTSSGVSLNDVLLAGPVIQDDLRSIIIRSCMKPILLVADVEKMFRQIRVHKEDCTLQSILWRESPGEEISTYELTTVTYGTKPAPFLATRTLQQLAFDEGSRFPLAAEVACRDVYMDDVITGIDDEQTAIQTREQLDQMLLRGGFKLRKWACNKAEVLEGVLPENLAIPNLDGIMLDPDPTVKTLGLSWMPTTDTLRFRFTIPSVEAISPFTKRRILSIIASLFDPLGLLGATITLAKLYMQMLWTLRDTDGNRLEWDEPLSSTVGEIWHRFHQTLHLLNEIRIERCVVIPNPVRVELHCFSDASEKAYGGCVYVRSLDAEGRVKVKLLSSKSRVAPLKTQTIPRLELCGALLVAQLYQMVSKALQRNLTTYFWTDSSCVLRWIASTPTTWAAFVANRVAKIQTITEGFQWRHVPGVDNPADLISRGLTATEILHNKLWWEGPMWLKENPNAWPTAKQISSIVVGEEEKRHHVVSCTTSNTAEFNDWYISKFSSYTDLVRRTAYWMRLIKLLKIPSEERLASEFLTTIELREAEFVLIRRVQEETFSEERKALSKNISISHRSPLRWFSPFLCENGLLRVGGRLGKSDGSEDAKHPIVLPARHQLTRLLLRHYHERLIHAGPQLLLSTIRLRYWPLGGRNTAREIVHACVKCFRAKPRAMQQFMGELPASRVTVARPFLRTGVDYFGPVYVRPAPRRAAVKGYVAVFICMCTKAVHLELVSDLSTERFMQALRRFVSRRGRCAEIFSDNGTNFVGARNKLAELLTMLKDRRHHEKIAKE